MGSLILVSFVFGIYCEIWNFKNKVMSIIVLCKSCRVVYYIRRCIFIRGEEFFFDGGFLGYIYISVVVINIKGVGYKVILFIRIREVRSFFLLRCKISVKKRWYRFVLERGIFIFCKNFLLILYFCKRFVVLFIVFLFLIYFCL